MYNHPALKQNLNITAKNKNINQKHTTNPKPLTTSASATVPYGSKMACNSSFVVPSFMLPTKIFVVDRLGML